MYVVCICYVCFGVPLNYLFNVEPSFQYKSIVKNEREFIMIKKQRKLCLLFINRSNSLKYQLDFILIHMILIKNGRKKNRKVPSLQLFGIRAILRNILKSLRAQLKPKTAGGSDL